MEFSCPKMTTEKNPFSVERGALCPNLKKHVSKSLKNKTFIMSTIKSSPINNFQIYPEVLKTCKDTDLDKLIFTLNKYGQQNPIITVERKGQLFIIDGVARFKACKQLNIPSLIYKVIDIDDDKVLQYRLVHNMCRKKNIAEICLEAEGILNTLGKSQGKKRKDLGFENMEDDSNYGTIGKDRFELTCHLLPVKVKASTLRKLMKIFWDEYNPEGKSESGIFELLNDGRISIDKAYQLSCVKDRKKKENSDRVKTKVIKMVKGGKKPYQLYCKSSLVMDEIPDGNLAMIIDSHPYFQLREYRNQDEMSHGQESTVEEYLKNFQLFNKEKFKKLKQGGVLVTIIGETYRNGYQGVCSKAELIIQDIGFNVLDVVISGKTNPRYAPHPLRFQNSYERIIVAYKPGAEPHFEDVYRKGCVDTFKIKKTSTNGYYVAKPETCIPNLIITPSYNSQELREIDPGFRHDAPCSPEIYKIFIEAYSKIGDTICDGFVGAGTIGVGLKMRRKIIGYDVDPLSIEFSQKRFEKYIQDSDENSLSIAA
jgi:DNA modification methylase